MHEDLNGLVLIGGKSTRMGTDKSSIQYYEEPHVQHLFGLMNGIIPETYVSVRKGQPLRFTQRLIEDAFEIKGPLNGLLSAHKAFPSKAWLVLAVDLPFVTKSTIEKLIGERDVNSMATAYVGSENGLPEPLAAIWEPRALDSLAESLEYGSPVYPRKFLIDNPIKSIQVEYAHELLNVNTEVDFEKAKSLIKK